jgi:hypothetical protein
MTQTKNSPRHAAPAAERSPIALSIPLGALFLILAALAVALGVGTAGAVGLDRVQPAAAAEIQRKDMPLRVQADLVALLPEGTDFTPGMLTEVRAAADRVCEGVTAGVPVMVMADTLAVEQGLTDPEARHFVNQAALGYC